jgi:hypothetical protein
LNDHGAIGTLLLFLYIPYVKSCSRLTMSFLIQ